MAKSASYSYTPLHSDRHIRLLQIISSGDPVPSKYRIVQRALSDGDDELEFEAVSYTWGDPSPFGSLVLEGNEGGSIGLTKNLTEALPFLSERSETKLLWIDQICINQNDAAEKGKQVALMTDIYKAASRVIVWLGPEDEDCHVCKEWLVALESMLNNLPNSEILNRSSTTYNPDRRWVVLRQTFSSPDTSPHFAPSIRRFFTRPWFTRGWIVQEFLLARRVLFLTGTLTLTLADLEDLHAIPPPTPTGPDDYTHSYEHLINLKKHPFTDPQPLRFLRLMYLAASEFRTSHLGDSLYAFLGMIPEARFTPDYSTSLRSNFTRFAAALAARFGSLDFLSMWGANLDCLVPITPKELLGFPSWVPSFWWVPLGAPFRLAVGGCRMVRGDVGWCAAGGWKHVHVQNEEVGGEEGAGTTGRLRVRGRIVDFVDAVVSKVRFQRYWDVDDGYLDGLVDGIKEELGGLEGWTRREMVAFLNVVAWNGVVPEETVDVVLGEGRQEVRESVPQAQETKHSLGLALSMGRGRRFMRTSKGKLGLAPAIGTKARNGEVRGSPIVILHGCSVPVILERVVDGGEGEGSDVWRLVGDCYVEGMMHGEVVEWEEEAADEFVLV
ncbi:HET-domain-containing protein [Westerdykella ornata]|uniref:HET-domain-containing protein n=1 Tax=Westerdykella ornata TaxID=318751 RepID=A0A6A6JN69_WESOR|nr:HET-domain-containing protein [Westerdykella ornata]KAF2277967.1 HET-domain-containing protein [Westerdykella ornata]